MMVLTPEQEISGKAEEMVASTQSTISEADAYERILGDAMVGDPTLFAREDYVEEAWRIVDPVVKLSTAVTQYEPGTWGPAEMQQRIAPPEGWHNPTERASPGEETLHAA
jgi:glucose-6-phosphate 1-dehydrogenase